MQFLMCLKPVVFPAPQDSFKPVLFPLDPFALVIVTACDRPRAARKSFAWVCDGQLDNSILPARHRGRFPFGNADPHRADEHLSKKHLAKR